MGRFLKGPGGAFEPAHHIVVVHRMRVDTAQERYLEVESPHEDNSSEAALIPESLLAQLMSFFDSVWAAQSRLMFAAFSEGFAREM